MLEGVPAVLFPPRVAYITLPSFLITLRTHFLHTCGSPCGTFCLVAAGFTGLPSDSSSSSLLVRGGVASSGCPRTPPYNGTCSSMPSFHIVRLKQARHRVTTFAFALCNGLRLLITTVSSSSSEFASASPTASAALCSRALPAASCRAASSMEGDGEHQASRFCVALLAAGGDVMVITAALLLPLFAS